MKLQIVLFTVCAIAWTEAARLVREADTTTTETATPEQEPCCYPRPPPRKDRGFKHQVNKCCEFPVADIWDKFYDDLQACKEENRKKHEEQESQQPPKDVTSTTTSAPADKDNEFDADLPESMEEEEVEEVEVTSTTASTASSTSSSKGRSGHHHHHHSGKGKGNKSRGSRGFCLKKTMEKHGWSNNGTIDWDVILRNTEHAANETAEEWIGIVHESISNCSKKPTPDAPQPISSHVEGRHHGCQHHFSPEKQAWRCIINNSIMKCPHFPENNEYCVQLREAHEKCSATSSGFGPKQFRWCGRPRGKKPVA